jgi:hypothetical protein
VFLAYVQEDTREVERLCDALEQHRFDPRFDRRRLLPGQNWPRSIEDAQGEADFCLKSPFLETEFRVQQAMTKAGFQQTAPAACR